MLSKIKYNFFAKGRVLGTIYIAFFILTFVLYLLVNWTSGLSEVRHKTKNSPAEHAEASMYTCSMHPQVRLDDPKAKCPICFMELIPVKTSGVELSNNQLALSKEARDIAGIQTFLVQDKSAVMTRTFSGSTRFALNQDKRLVAHVQGEVLKIYDFTEGMEIEKGSLLFALDSPDFLEVQDGLLSSKAESKSASLFEKRLIQFGVAREDIHKIKQGQMFSYMPVRAGSDLKVLELLVSRGEYVGAEQSLAKIIENSSLWFEFQVFEDDIEFFGISKGKRAKVHLDALPQERLDLQIVSVDLVSRTEERSYMAKGRLGREMDLPAGINGRVSFQIEQSSEYGNFLPKTSILRAGEKALVFLEHYDQGVYIYTAKEVRLGKETRSYYEVIGGLKAGERVVSKAAYRLDSELQEAAKKSLLSLGREPHKSGSSSSAQGGTHVH